VVAYIIDRFIITGISLVFFYFAEMTFDPVRAELLDTCLSFLLPIVFGVYMIRRFSGTPGQLLCSIHKRCKYTWKYYPNASSNQMCFV